jgi:tol-pal system protein YbgF
MAPILPCHLLAAAAFCLALGQVSAATAEEARVDAQRVARLEQQVAAARAQMPRIEVAQLARPPGSIPGDNADDSDTTGPAPAQQDASGLDLRVDRLEGQVRALNGQIEQTQFQIHRLSEQLKAFQEEVDARLPDAAGHPRPVPQKHADATDPLPLGAEPPAAATNNSPPRKKTDDAFDPNAEPSAPGAPRPLGSTPAAPVAADAQPGRPPGQAIASNEQEQPYPTGPLDLNAGVPQRVPALPDELGSTSAPAPATTLPGPATVAPANNANLSTASLPGGTPREEFEAAIGHLKQGQYETAQTDFEAFLQKYPKDRLDADAVFYLGETFSARGRHREAAEQYLKVATDYSRSLRAPEGLVHLGVSLNALGAKEQACATFGEVARKYPNASVAIKNSADRESKRAKC